MHTKNFFPSIYDRIKAKNFKSNFISTQFISSHGHFKSYLVRFHISDDYLCDCGKAIETPLHLILNCDQYINERQQLIYEAERVGLNWPINPKSLIENRHLLIEFNNFLEYL
jgi:hypothetical protein